MIGQLGGPEEVVPPRDGMDGTDQDLDPDLHHALPGHGDPPIVGTIVYHEQLRMMYVSECKEEDWERKGRDKKMVNNGFIKKVKNTKFQIFLWHIRQKGI